MYREIKKDLDEIKRDFSQLKIDKICEKKYCPAPISIPVPISIPCDKKCHPQASGLQGGPEKEVVKVNINYDDCEKINRCDKKRPNKKPEKINVNYDDSCDKKLPNKKPEKINVNYDDSRDKKYPDKKSSKINVNYDDSHDKKSEKINVNYDDSHDKKYSNKKPEKINVNYDDSGEKKYSNKKPEKINVNYDDSFDKKTEKINVNYEDYSDKKISKISVNYEDCYDKKYPNKKTTKIDINYDDCCDESPGKQYCYLDDDPVHETKHNYHCDVPDYRVDIDINPDLYGSVDSDRDKPRKNKMNLHMDYSDRSDQSYQSYHSDYSNKSDKNKTKMNLHVDYSDDERYSHESDKNKAKMNLHMDYSDNEKYSYESDKNKNRNKYIDSNSDSDSDSETDTDTESVKFGYNLHNYEYEPYSQQFCEQPCLPSFISPCGVPCNPCNPCIPCIPCIPQCVPCNPQCTPPCTPPCSPCPPCPPIPPSDPCTSILPPDIISTQTGIISPTTDLTIIEQPASFNNILSQTLFSSQALNTHARTLWAARVAGINLDIGTSVRSDSEHNIIVVGYYFALASSIVSPGSITTAFNADASVGKSITTNGQEDAFVVKYSPEGKVIWIIKIGGTSADRSFGAAVDLNDNIIVTGTFMSTLFIYNSNEQLVAELISNGLISSYVIKFDSNGSYIWSNAMYASDIISSQAVQTDSINNIYLTGYYNGTDPTFLNSDLSIGAILPNSEFDDVFIVKYNTIGMVEFATRAGNTGIDHAESIDISPDGSVVITGFYSSNNFILYNAPDGLVPSPINLTNQSTGQEAFIIKYSPTGQAIWATQIVGIANEQGLSVTVDTVGSVIISGLYTSPIISINNTPNGSIPSGLILGNSGLSGLSDVMVVKFSPEGIALWATRIAGTLNEQGLSIGSDSNNSIVVTGFYASNPLTIYNSDQTAGPILSNIGLTNAFVAKFNQLGHTIYATKLSNISSVSSTSLTIDSGDKVILTGYYFSVPLEIYDSDGILNKILQHSGNSDAFIVNYAEYLQQLVLPPSICQTKRKTILLGKSNGTTTLITVAPGLITDIDGRIIIGILLRGSGSNITILWHDNRWDIISNQGAEFIYA